MDYLFAQRVAKHILQSESVNIPVLVRKGEMSCAPCKPNGDAISIILRTGSMERAARWGFREYKSIQKQFCIVHGTTGYMGLWALAMHECAHSITGELYGLKRNDRGYIYHGKDFCEVYAYLITEYPYSDMKLM